MISLDQWAQIRALSKSEGVPGREIARRLGVSRNTVVRALALDEAPAYERRCAGSMVDVFVPRMREVLLEHPCMAATVLAERVGYPNRHASIFRARVAQLKAELFVADPADRLEFTPGEQFQCDLIIPGDKFTFQGRKITHPVLVIVDCFSRLLQAIMVPSRACGDLLSGMNVLLARFGVLPKALLWDNEAGLVARRQLIPQALAWSGSLGLPVKLAPVRDPETKGRVERHNRYIETSFLPGREFTSINDFNAQLETWLDTVANGERRPRATGEYPSVLFTQNVQGLRVVPDILPAGGIRSRERLGRDYYVRVDRNDYSVHPAAIGHFVQVATTLDRVLVYWDSRLVADHERVFDRAKTITDPGHVQAAKRQRAAFQAGRASNRE